MPKIGFAAVTEDSATVLPSSMDPAGVEGAAALPLCAYVPLLPRADGEDLGSSIVDVPVEI